MSVLLGSGGGASWASPVCCRGVGDPFLKVPEAIDRLGGGTAGAVDVFDPIENRRSDPSPAVAVGETGLLSRLGFFGLIGGAGFRCVAEEMLLRDDEGDMVVGVDAGASSLFAFRRGGSCGLVFSSNGRGNFRGPLDVTEDDRVTSAEDGILSILIQSGSSPGVNGFAARAGFGTAPLLGGLRFEYAG